ncbi:MAG: uracil-DNA glycosylase family protein [Minisyncoccia bacterium]
MEKGPKHDALEKIRSEVVALKKSPLYEYRQKNGYQPVIGEGNSDARIMLIGEAPGKREAETGRPFCGAAGKLLDQMLAANGIERQSVYTTNIVKDRPPENRDPTPAEIALYAPFLTRQIDIIKPKVLAALGRFSYAYVMRAFGLESLIEPIGKARGKTFEAQASYGKVVIFPLYHPAAALYNQRLKSTLSADFNTLANFEK